MKAWVQYWIDVAKATVRVWLDAQVFVHAAALAFFTVFSVAPVMIVAVSIVGLVLGERAAHGEIVQQLEAAIGVEAATAVQTAVQNSRIQHSGLLPTIAGFAAMVFGATTVFAQMQGALNAIWSVAPRPTRSGVLNYLKTRLLSLTVVLAIGFVLLVSLTLSVAVRALVTFAQDWLPVPGFVLLGLDWGVSLVVITLLFGAIFRVLPDVVLSWRDVWLGALVTSLLFVLGRTLIALYLSTTATASSYGAAGSLVLLLMWVNYSSLILLFGAAFTRATVEASGRRIVPRPTAVCVKRSPVQDVDPVA
ncbi:YihY/virulence factor BrkB family protein [Thauera linaloolentis]|uniref:Ribonuclease BN n=1 Tax=Thauera linaloolentis (strain DSM 12138 / JCM 21573 / CCUG 41526 / CIP 105981 / IAM 15112 / NBRC 102519 / 47Lol) TaxID=1123367 RepID=N6YZB4_THAL4|nr:YihY/virulence factor BrkB family protein [Thauera linaloolentis]ENO85269.1 ribonuclease BN [Thauera linaloolentis 47Lol = DSM 12138]MCM8564964.1 YihY/virulence factor BrkB family protein [Thauera linaloolentis]